MMLSDEYEFKSEQWKAGYRGFWNDAALYMSESAWRTRTSAYRAGMKQAGKDYEQVLKTDRENREDAGIGPRPSYA